MVVSSSTVQDPGFFLSFAAVFIYPCAVLVGMPTWLACRRWLLPTLPTLLLTCCFVAAVWAMAMEVVLGRDPWGDNIAVLDLLIADWGHTVAAALCGGLGGTVFWLTAIADWRRPGRRQRDATPGP